MWFWEKDSVEYEEAGLIESAAFALIVIRFFQKLNKIPMAKNASLS
ncbi:hypothetical protein COO91_01378 [Nostoc flagelliforme CCNUN1]|uniref:Uncharacterized protein n=1 Tax=Nostoc flagelliforme CCNUN1 TaxID=2038116 RepID=A0A2K8SJA8_9NOSO|nr:hypothetical protein COO91_01378 [Nostoc flagelliforme CCNUN1]